MSQTRIRELEPAKSVLSVDSPRSCRLAAYLAPGSTRSKHQSLHHFVADSVWSDEEALRRVAQWVEPAMDFSDGGWWIVDDAGFPKQGTHSVGVARQYCDLLGKQDNCQVAVSVSLAAQGGSLAVAWQLYLPKQWSEDHRAAPACGESLLAVITGVAWLSSGPRDAARRSPALAAEVRR